MIRGTLGATVLICWIMLLAGNARAETSLPGSPEAAPRPSGPSGPSGSTDGRDPRLLVHPEIKELGGGRYQIGNIEIDREKEQFTVSGRMLGRESDNSPIEFLAVTTGSSKAYEALIEIDASAVAFNLACILIGLDRARATRPERHFDERVLEGDIVDVRVSWVDGDEQQVHEMEQLLNVMAMPSPSGLLEGEGSEKKQAPAPGSDRERETGWVYTGSYFAQSGDFLASQLGTLIGVVHDPWSIIQHRTGLGLGSYGAVTANEQLSPVAGTRMTITVVKVSEGVQPK